MKSRDIVKWVLFGAAAYGLYKFGEKKGREFSKSKLDSKSELIDSETENIEETEEEYIKGLIYSLRNRPNKSKKDKDTIELLEVKLKQIQKK